jgi:DNA-binding HxlR family transcriptional regulator
MTMKYLDRKVVNGRKHILGGLSIIYLKQFLDASFEPRSYSELSRVSPVIFKKGFQKYLSWCVERQMISRTQFDPENELKGVIYHITPKGRTLSEMLK